MPRISPVHRSPFTLAIKLGRRAFELGVMAAIAAAVWLSGSAAYENIHFVHTTGQILSLIAIARDDAAKEPGFGRADKEDLIADLLRRGQMPGTAAEQAAPKNAWDGAIRATVMAPDSMRLETDLPTRDCRRLALFFGKDAADLGLVSMEAGEKGGLWHKFYAQTANGGPNYAAADAACGMGGRSALAFILRLR